MQALHKTRWQAAWSQRLSATQAQVLLYLLAMPSQPTTITELARYFDLKQSTLSDAVSALVRKGLIERDPAPTDLRVVRLKLSPQGRRVAQQLGQWIQPLRDQLAQLQTPHKQQLLGTLLHLIAGLQRAGIIQVAQMCTNCLYFEPHRHNNPRAPHHCHLLNQPLPLVELRLHCPDHRLAPTAKTIDAAS